MIRSSKRPIQSMFPVLVAGALAACAPAAGPAATPTPAAPPVETVVPRTPYTEADVAFMQGMIHHHAQATIMAAWAPTHGASPELQRLAARIVVGQDDEIAIMQRWLRDRGEDTPEPDTTHGGVHSAHAGMPGMLTSEELARLDAAEGVEFDRLFLTLMIRHHQGAITMVDQLFGSHGAAQDDTVFRLASDVQADQVVEIRRMRAMLDQLSSPSD